MGHKRKFKLVYYNIQLVHTCITLKVNGDNKNYARWDHPIPLGEQNDVSEHRTMKLAQCGHLITSGDQIKDILCPL